MDYLSPFRQRRLIRQMQEGRSYGRPSAHQRPCPVSPFSREEELELTGAILGATSPSEFEGALKQVVKKGARSKKKSRPGKRGPDRKAPQPQTVSARLKQFWDKHLKKPAIATAATVGTSALGWAVPKALDYIATYLSNLEVASQLASHDAVSEFESARRIVRSLGTAASNLANLPEAIPVRVAVDLEMKRMKSRRPRPGNRAGSTTIRRPWKSRKDRHQKVDHWNGHYHPGYGATLISNTVDYPMTSNPPEDSSGDWQKKDGGVIVVLNCTPHPSQGTLERA